MKKQYLKILIIVLIVFLLAVMTLTALGLIDPLVIWILIIISGVFAFKVLPKIKK